MPNQTDTDELVSLDTRSEILVRQSVIDRVNPSHRSPLDLKRHRRLLAQPDGLRKLDHALDGRNPARRGWDLLLSEIPRIVISLVLAAAALAAILASLYWLAERYLPTEL